MIIKDWWYAIKVCKKYNIWWNPFFTTTHAEFVFKYNTGAQRESQSTIRINPFYKGGFLDSFMHEVGHCLRFRSEYQGAKNVKDFKAAISDCFYEEYSAWKFAKRTRKSNFNKKRAVSFFQTYFPTQAKAVGSIVAADQFYKMSRSIEK